jgi:hypothetical protein
MRVITYRHGTIVACGPSHDVRQIQITPRKVRTAPTASTTPQRRSQISLNVDRGGQPGLLTAGTCSSQPPGRDPLGSAATKLGFGLGDQVCGL